MTMKQPNDDGFREMNVFPNYIDAICTIWPLFALLMMPNTDTNTYTYICIECRTQLVPFAFVSQGVSDAQQQQQQQQHNAIAVGSAAHCLAALLLCCLLRSGARRRMYKYAKPDAAAFILL